MTRLQNLFFSFSLCTALVGGAALVPRAALAQDASAAKSYIETSVNGIREVILAEKGKTPELDLQKKLENMLRPIFDFQEMSKSSLGTNWAKATPEEQREFMDLFTELLAKSYLKKIYENIETSQISFLEPVQRDQSVVVRTLVASKGDEFPVDYRLRYANGKWYVYDVVVENVGLISNYRNEFLQIVRKEKMSGLLARLREKTAKGQQQAKAL